MLPAPHRLTRGVELRRVSRHGRRRGGVCVVVHLLLPDAVPDADLDDVRAQLPRVGFVVGRVVGNSVVRHRVQRRLRELCRERLAALPPGAELVVRALPAAGGATYAELGADLDRCLERVLHPGAGTVS